MKSFFAKGLERISVACAAIGGLWGIGIAASVVGISGIAWAVRSASIHLESSPSIETRVNIIDFEKIGELVVLKVFDEFVITKTNETGNASATYITPCDALLSLDFSKVQTLWTNDTYYVTLPEFKVLQPRVDRNGLELFETSKKMKGIFEHTDKLRSEVLAEAEDRIAQIASEPQYHDAARTRTTNIVTSLLCNGMGREAQEVQFCWIWPDSQTNSIPSPMEETP